MRTIMSLSAAVLITVGTSATSFGRSVDAGINATPVTAQTMPCDPGNGNALRFTSAGMGIPGCATTNVRTSQFYKQNIVPLALTIWAESRGEGERGMRLVGNVILNRLNKGRWGSDINSVVTAPAQFSPWARGSATRRRLEAMRVSMLRGSRDGVPTDFQTALGIADDLLVDELNKSRQDESLGAIYFHAKSIRPAWSARDRVTVRYGGHVFLR